MLLQYGDFQFTIGTAAYDRLQRRARGRWAKIPLLGGGEALQALGTENDVITLAGTVYPQMSRQVGGQVGTAAIDELRDLVHDNLPFLLQSADGFNLGYWVPLELTNIDSIYQGSIPRKQQFQITLQYYGETADES